LLLTAGAEADFLVAYQVEFTSGQLKGNEEIMAYRLRDDGRPVWHKPVTATPQVRERNPLVVPDNAGGMIVVFEAQLAGGDLGGTKLVLAQRISAEGALRWNKGERASLVALRAEHPVAISDGQGGCFVACEVQSEDSVDIGVQHITAEGTMLWGQTSKDQKHTLIPVLLGRKDADEHHPALLADKAGGVWVAFETHLGGGRDVDLYAQRVSAPGRLLWDTGRKGTVVSSTRLLEREPVLVPGLRDSALVIFEAEFTEGRYQGDVDILAQRLSAEGECLWHDGERPSLVSSISVLRERHPAAVSDGLGGALVVFQGEYRGGEYKGDVDILAQRISSRGNLRWNEGKKPTFVASSQLLERQPRVVSDGRGGAIVVFEIEVRGERLAGARAVMTQRLSREGERLWNEGKKSSLVGIQCVSPGIAPDGERGVVVVMEQQGGKETEIVAQRISSDGQMQWGQTSDKGRTTDEPLKLGRPLPGSLTHPAVTRARLPQR